MMAHGGASRFARAAAFVLATSALLLVTAGWLPAFPDRIDVAGSSGQTATAEGNYEPLPGQPLPSLADRPGPVLVVPITGTIDLGLPPFVDRALAEKPAPAVVILDVDTFGGRVDAAVRIRDRLLALDVPTIAFVTRRAR